jgi:hypothetical protein
MLPVQVLARSLDKRPTKQIQRGPPRKQRGMESNIRGAPAVEEDTLNVQTPTNNIEKIVVSNCPLYIYRVLTT